MHEFEDLSDALFGCPLSRVAIFDTETTGFSDGDEILEIYQSKAQNNKNI